MNTLSVNDTSRLITDVRVVVEMLCPDVDARKLIVRLEELFSNYKIERKADIDVEMDMPEKIEMFIDAMKIEGLSEVTLDGYLRDLTLFSGYVGKAAVQVTTADIRKYLASNKDNAMSTVSKKLTILKSFFSWLVKEELLLRDPAVKIKNPKLPKRLPKGLSIEELELIRESCTGLRQRALIEFLYSTGCRLDEVSNIKRSEIDYQNMSVHVIGKGNKERIVYLSFKSLYHLNKYLNSRTDESEYLFVTVRKPYRQMGHRAIQREITKINKKIKLSKVLTPHVLRHTLANNLLNNGADLADVQAILGHSDPGTTLIYSQVSEERKKRAFEKSHIQ